MSAPLTGTELFDLDNTAAAMQASHSLLDNLRGKLMARALNELRALRAECCRCLQCGGGLMYAARQRGTGVCLTCKP